MTGRSVQSIWLLSLPLVPISVGFGPVILTLRSSGISKPGNGELRPRIEIECCDVAVGRTYLKLDLVSGIQGKSSRHFDVIPLAVGTTGQAMGAREIPVSRVPMISVGMRTTQ